LKGSVSAENFTEEAVRDPDVQDIVAKIELSQDLDKENGIETEVKMKDGIIFSEYVYQAAGEYPHTLSREALIDKFMTQVEFSQTVSRQNAEKLIELLIKLEKVENIRQIMELATI
jgi:2-methylcitrate dehydratase PrpD